MSRPISRKQFLASTTKTVAAFSAGAVAASVIPASGQSLKAGITNQAATAWPWRYATLDREDVRKRAHKSYFDGGCCYGAFNGIIAALAEAVGEPFASMPPQMMYWGGGGGAGWGTLCGALNGAAGAISLVVDRTNASAIIGELFGWYTTFPFPSDISNDYATAHVFLVNRYDKPLKQTVAGSTLCHPSVSSWCTEAGFRATSTERAERCARLTGDTAARAVELLNAYHAGKFKPTFTPPDSFTNCLTCHASTVGNVQSGVKMDCVQCHNESFDHLH